MGCPSCSRHEDGHMSIHSSPQTVQPNLTRVPGLQGVSAAGTLASCIVGQHQDTVSQLCLMKRNSLYFQREGVNGPDNIARQRGLAKSLACHGLYTVSQELLASSTFLAAGSAMKTLPNHSLVVFRRTSYSLPFSCMGV